MNQNGSHHIPIRYKCIGPKNTSEAISLVQFAKQQYIDVSTARYWLRTRKITGYKIGGRWYVYPLVE